MKPTELHTLFNAKEQTLLVATEKDRLAEMSEDDLDTLLTLVRRERTKYTKLYRRQSAAHVDEHSSRAGTKTSNQRTKRKAEIFEDALSRVAKALSVAAKETANELKRERLEAAAAAKGSPQGRTAPQRTPKTTTPTAGRGARHTATKGGAASSSRQASSKAQGSRRQASRDSR
jgi:hypothetical protein